MASAEYPNKAARQATEPSVSNAPIESPSVAPDDTLTRLDEIEKRWQDQADINTDVQFLLAEVTRLREELAARERIIEVYEKQLASAEDMARKRIRS
jgi:predicted RNase H-like nuclease (RuvC/YqgF family)